MTYCVKLFLLLLPLVRFVCVCSCCGGVDGGGVTNTGDNSVRPLLSIYLIASHLIFIFVSLFYRLVTFSFVRACDRLEGLCESVCVCANYVCARAWVA